MDDNANLRDLQIILSDIFLADVSDIFYILFLARGGGRGGLDFY